MMTSGCNSLVVICLLALTSISPAAPPPLPGPMTSVPVTPVSQLAVDVVPLKQGKPLRGAVLEQRADGSLLMVVAEAWLKQHDPVRHAKLLEDTAQTRQRAWQTTAERIDVALGQPVESPRLRFFLEQEQQRLQKLRDAEKPPVPEFLWVELKRQEISKVVRPAPDRHRIGIFAWYAKLGDIEQRSAASLQKELASLDYPVAGPLPDLGTRLSPREQSDQEWAARLAIVEYGLSDPVEFQGTGDLLVQTGTGKGPDWQAILPALLEQQTQGLLKDLLGQPPIPAPDESARLQSAIARTKQLGRRAFRVTRVDAPATQGQVAVESRFLVQLEDETWRPVWSCRQFANSSQPREELEQKIAADPQVQAIVRSMQALGLTGDDLLRQAIRHGAATMDAQEQVNGEFLQFRDRYLNRLDGPYLPLPRP